jgi:hypothetical protein
MAKNYMRKAILIFGMIFSGLTYAQQATNLAVLDTRDVNSLPSAYSQIAKVEFKFRDVVQVPGIGNYSSMLTIAPWVDSSGNKVHQLNFNDGGVFYRTASQADSQWGNWNQLLMANVNGDVGIGTTDPRSKIDVWGNILTGNTNATEGINAFAIRYENGSLNNWGSLRSSAATYMSFGAKADNNIGNGWVSSNGTLNFSKVAITLNDDGIKFLTSPQQMIALNSPVAMNEIMKIAVNGNAALQGKFEAKEVKVTLTPTADFVFDEEYKLPELDEVEKHIKEKKHLPEIASAAQMEKEGVNIGEFQIKLLQKIEELTLYTIEQNKQLKKLQENNDKLMKEMDELKAIKK